MLVKFEIRIFSRIGTAFNAPKIYGGYLTLTTLPFRKIFKGHVWTVPGNMPAKLEVRSFNRVGIISTYCPNI